jgi:hypothetical protein
MSAAAPFPAVGATPKNVTADKFGAELDAIKIDGLRICCLGAGAFRLSGRLDRRQQSRRVTQGASVKSSSYALRGDLSSVARAAAL